MNKVVKNGRIRVEIYWDVSGDRPPGVLHGDELKQFDEYFELKDSENGIRAWLNKNCIALLIIGPASESEEGD